MTLEVKLNDVVSTQRIYGFIGSSTTPVKIGGLSMNYQFWPTMWDIAIPLIDANLYSYFNTCPDNSYSVTINGRPHRRPRNLYTLLNSGWQNEASFTKALLTDWNFRVGSWTVKDENPTLHQNVVGKILVSPDEYPRLYEAWYTSEGPLSWNCKRRFYDRFTFVDESNINIGYRSRRRDAITWALDGVFPDPLLDHESFSWGPTNGDGVKRLYVHWDTSNTIRLAFAFCHGTWTGIRHFGAEVFKVEVSSAINTDFVPTIGTLHYLKDLVDFNVTVSSKILASEIDISEVDDFTRDDMINYFGWSTITGFCHSEGGWDNVDCGEVTFSPIFERNVPPLSYSLTLSSDEVVESISNYANSIWKSHGCSLPACTGAAYFSSIEALDASMSRLKTNWIETISELGDFIKIYEKISGSNGGNKAMKAMRVYGISDFIRKVGSLYLLLNFAVLPNITAAKESTQFLAKLIEFFDESNYESFYGSQNFSNVTFSDEPDVICDVTVRSKVLARCHSDAVNLLLTYADSIGFLPTPERIWASVSKSFLIDIAHNFSNDLQYLTDFFRSQILLDIELSVHSVLMRTYIADGVTIDGFNLESINDEGKYPAITTFLRWPFNLGVPVMGPTELLPSTQKTLPVSIWGALFAANI